MKKRLIPALALCSLSTSLLPAAEPLTVITEGASPYFMNVVSHLEVGGAALSYHEQSSLWMSLGKWVDESLAKMPAEQRKDMPVNLSVAELFKVAGLDRIKAVGSSARTLPSGPTHLTSFAAIPEGRAGLLTLAGGKAEPLLLHALAPKGTDLVLEFPLHTKDAARPLLDHVRPLMPARQRSDMDKQLNTAIPILGISNQELLEKLAARAAWIVRLDPEQQLPAGSFGVALPGMDSALVIERAGWLLEPLKQQLLPAIKGGGAPVEVKEEGEVLTISFKGAMGPGPMDFQPCLRYDKAADRLIIASRTSFLAALLDPSDKLAKTPEFEAGWQGMPAEGNSAAFVSLRLQQALLGLIPQIMKEQKAGKDELAFVESILGWVKPYAAHPQAFCQVNLADGTQSYANTTLPLTQPSTLTTITAISILSSLAVPTFNVIQDMSKQTQMSNNGRQVVMALKIYANDNGGSYPAKLSKLMSEDIIQDERVLTAIDPKTSEQTAWLYDATLTASSPGDAIVLATPFTYRGKDGGKRVIVQNDGSALVIAEAEFQERRKDTLE